MDAKERAGACVEIGLTCRAMGNVNVRSLCTPKTNVDVPHSGRSLRTCSDIPFDTDCTLRSTDGGNDHVAYLYTAFVTSVPNLKVLNEPKSSVVIIKTCPQYRSRRIWIREGTPGTEDVRKHFTDDSRTGRDEDGVRHQVCSSIKV